MKVLSLAVDGLERAHAEGLLTWAFQQGADVICFQDTRCSEYSLPSNDFFPENYHAYFADNYDDDELMALSSIKTPNQGKIERLKRRIAAREGLQVGDRIPIGIFRKDGLDVEKKEVQESPMKDESVHNRTGFDVLMS